MVVAEDIQQLPPEVTIFVEPAVDHSSHIWPHIPTRSRPIPRGSITPPV